MNDAAQMIQARSITDIQQAVVSSSKLAIRGGGTKSALCGVPVGVTRLDTQQLSGILEYQPGEYTFTALAGTPVREVEAALAEHGQYLPFDPPLVDAGSTLGGVVASGLSGSGRNRYGGVRDFIIGVRFVDGRGRVVRGGGKVVKNAAGFDLPKLMVGSLGRLGVIAEVSFKVFPRPRDFATLTVSFPSVTAALQSLQRLALGPYDLDALDLAPSVGSAPEASLWLRIGGLASVLPDRLARLRGLLGSGSVVETAEETGLWRGVREFAWIPSPDTMLVKTPVTLAVLPRLDQQLAAANAVRRYSSAGNVAWIGWMGTVASLDELLTSLGLSGLVVRGAPERPNIGVCEVSAFARRVKSALDPDARFLEL
jgi:glycolate oxidase FAD binding subunit